MSKSTSALTQYALLGRSGLRVSPLCLGTMTFGTEWGWGTEAAVAETLLDAYVEAGGNFIDTADGYTGGTSETIIGHYVKKKSLRDRLVLATKYSFGAEPGNPNAGGNGRKNLLRALEGSLRRLQTDYIDLYWVHAWDGLTPVEEVMRTLDDAVRAGKIRHIGLSDTPAWYVARAQTLAEWRGYEPVCALQLEYSLLERNIEREHIPAALELQLGVCPWSPLASGMLTGKYTRSGTSISEHGRLPKLQGAKNPAFEKLFTERNWRITEEFSRVAAELGKPAAQVALNWIGKRRAVASTIIGATSLKQLQDNLLALDWQMPDEVSAQLDALTVPELVHPYHFFEPRMQRALSSGTFTRGAQPWNQRANAPRA